MQKIEVLIVDDNEEIQINISKLLEFHPQIKAVGVVSTAKDAIAKVKSLKPDIVLMDINMPGMDGITAASIISAEAPGTSIIMISVQGEVEYLRSSMRAGARNYLIKPFSSDELYQAITQVFASEKKRKAVENTGEKPVARGKVITVFSTKGGVGKTTIATNLAVALSLKTTYKVAIVDMDLQFGDVALFLNIIPRSTIRELVHNFDHLNVQMLDEYMHSCGDSLKVLVAPRRPEDAEAVTGSHVTAIIETLRQSYDYIIVDTVPSFQDTIIALLDATDEVLMISATDLPTIKNVKLGIEIIKNLGCSEDKIKLILNWAESESGISKHEVEKMLNQGFIATLPSDWKTVLASVNRGIPFVVSNPETNVSQGVFQLAKLVTGEDWDSTIKSKDGLVHKIKQLFI